MEVQIEGVVIFSWTENLHMLLLLLSSSTIELLDTTNYIYYIN
jgi:hypothetical protein